MRLQGSDNSHARKQHRSAIFGGIDEHLNSKPPFLTITFWLGKLPDVVGGVSQGLRRRSLREWNRLSEWTIPGHAELPSQTSKRTPARPRLSRVPEEPEARGFDAEPLCWFHCPKAVCTPRDHLPELRVPIVVGSQYPETARIVGTYGVAALANALLNLWISYFIGRGEMRVGLLLAVAVVAEVALLLTKASDPLTMARIVLVVALATQGAAIATFVLRKARAG